MQAAILQEPRRFILEERPVPEPDKDELLVRTRVCGICTSELDMWEGKSVSLQFPLFLGHEVSGVVEAVGKKVTGVVEGDHVAVWTYGKGYAEHVAVKEEHAVKLSRDVPLDCALGEPIACAVNGVRKADVQMNDSVCIVGAGFMGLIMLQVFKVRGVGLLIAVDTRESILEMARKLGATHTLNPRQVDVKKTVHDLTNGRGVDVGVEAAGLQETLDLTTDIVRMEGKLEVFGYHQGEPRRVNWAHWNWMAFQIINGHVRSPSIYVEGMRIGIGLLESKKLNMDLLVTHRFPLEKINHGFELASSKQEGFVKGVITF